MVKYTDKNEWLSDKCTELEGMGITDKVDMYIKKETNRTKEILIKRMHKIQDRDTDIREKKTLQKWDNCIGEIFHDKGEQAIPSQSFKNMFEFDAVQAFETK